MCAKRKLNLSRPSPGDASRDEQPFCERKQGRVKRRAVPSHVATTRQESRQLYVVRDPAFAFIKEAVWEGQRPLLTYDPIGVGQSVGGGRRGASVLAELTRAAGRVAGQAGRAPIANWPLKSNQLQPLEWKIDFL